MNETFVTHEQAVKLKELGFDWKCDHYWNKEFADIDKMFLRKALNNGNFNNEYYSLVYSAPRLDQAQKWLWENKRLHVYAMGGIFDKENESPWYTPIIEDAVNGHDDIPVSDMNEYDTPEKALSAAITEALKFLEKACKNKEKIA